ncbi:MAG TPA: hypothetical protein VHD76_10450 [Bryobacteraceae bacterium]|jgi:hypothetical protein|nr:hypothetical protein [Bryobacteraceae bacterium]
MKHLHAPPWAEAAALLLGAIALLASTPWEKKDPSQWSSEDVDQILHKSPWARNTDATFERSGTQQGRRGGGGGGGGMGIPGIGFPGGRIGGGGMGGGRMGGGGMGRGRGGQGTERQPALVRWDSAFPVVQALNHFHPQQTSTGENTPAKPAGDSYVISVIGLRPPRGRRGEDTGDTSSNTNSDDAAQRWKDELMIGTRLTPKGRDPLSPSEVQLDSAGGLSEVRFLFPKKDPISLDDKEVDFSTRLGGEKVEAKFHPKEMKYKGKLEL